MANRRLRVFFCYSSEDKHIMERFYRRLITEHWIDLWLDEERILPGMNRDVEIERAVETADAVIACLSHNSVTKEGQAQRELRLVLDAASEKPEGAIFIIPLQLDECRVPRGMRHLQPIDFSLPEEREQAYDRLLKSLEMQADMVNKQTGKTRAAHVISSPDLQPLALEISDFPELKIQSPDTQTQDTKVQNVQAESCARPWIFDGFNFLEIPTGKFIIGSKASNLSACDNEIPQCPCTIPYKYWISRFPISNEQFSEFAFSTKYMAVLPKDWRKKLNHPIVNVSWHDAVSYTRWLNEVFGSEIPSGTVFRLPTEAEWERASRGDSAFEWPWGNESLDELLEKKGSSQIKNEVEMLRCTLNITNVGSFSPLMDSPLGVADMMGSILEWTQSLYAPYPYDYHDGRENLQTEGKRVIRGYFNSPEERFSVRSARRTWAFPDKKLFILGFRIVIAPPVSR